MKFTALITPAMLSRTHGTKVFARTRGHIVTQFNHDATGNLSVDRYVEKASVGLLLGALASLQLQRPSFGRLFFGQCVEDDLCVRMLIRWVLSSQPVSQSVIRIY